MSFVKFSVISVISGVSSNSGNQPGRKSWLKPLQAIKDAHIKRKDRFFKCLHHSIDEENVDKLEEIDYDKDSSDSEHEDGKYSDHNLYCESITDVTMDQQPQALEEIQDKNQEGELQPEI